MPKGVYKHKVFQGFQINNNWGSLTKGHTVSLEQRNKISIANKGKHYSPNTELKTKYGEKKEINCSFCNKKIIRYAYRFKNGEKQYCNQKCYWSTMGWNGDKNSKLYASGWNKTLKQLILRRDDNRCQNCGVPQEECIKKLNIHHIDYNKHNHSHNNLITLCRSCHNKTLFDRENWKNKFKEKMEVANEKV